MREKKGTEMMKLEKATVRFQSSAKTCPELQHRDRTRGVIAPDSIEVVTVVAMAGIKLVLELHKGLTLAETTSNKTTNRNFQKEKARRGDKTE